MKKFLVPLFSFLLHFSLAFSSLEEEPFEFDVPEGYELCSIEEEGIEEDEEFPAWKFVRDLFKPNESDPDVNAALVTLGSGPSAIVANCVNAITGDFFDSQIDLYVPGPVPFIVQRSYCSSENEWHFQHIPLLKVVPSGGNHHLSAGYQDDNGSGMLYRTKISNSPRDRIRGEFKIPEGVFKGGLTNCGCGEISGQTNWQNSSLSFLRKKDEKFYLLRHGSHVQRLFCREKHYKKRHRKGAPIGKFHLMQEKHPNGNRLDYFYREEVLCKVEATSSSGKSLGNLRMEKNNLVTRWTHGKTSVDYAFDRNQKKLLHVDPSHSGKVSYSYDIKGRLKRKIEPDNRFLYIEYDPDGRVQSLKGPLGINHSVITTHAFSYPEKGVTEVRDALHHLTQYRYNKETKRLQAILRFDEGNALYSKDQFYWVDKGMLIGNLIARVFEGDGKIYFCRRLNYDDFGNIALDSLYGNLTGTSDHVLQVKEGRPLNADEVYVKTSRYSQDGWNVLLEENDGRKQIECSYYLNTNLLKSRLTKCGDEILKREFFDYQEGVVVRESWDDGIASDENDLSGVTERHIKFTTLTTQAPIGLPETIEEHYWENNQYLLLKKNVRQYTEQGKLLKEEHYGSDGSLAFTNYWDYDTLGNVIEKIDALNHKTTYKYDENSNKIYEEDPLPGFHKTFKYDHANRLVEEKEVWEEGTCLTTTHTYNALSQRIATVDIHGNETTYTYDFLGRLVSTKFPPVINAQGAYLFPEEKTAYDAMGNAVAKWDANGDCTKKDYTLRGKEWRTIYPDGSQEQKVYSLDGLLVCEIAKNGLQTHYQHDPFGRLIHTEVKDSQGTLLKSTSATYNTFHLLTETDEEGLVTVYEYDGAGQKTSKTCGDHHTTYQYDSMGRITRTIDSIDETNARITVQVYDSLDRVIEERIEDEKGSVLKQEQYQYDAAGNRTHVIAYTQAGKSETVTKYNPHGKPVSITDALGNTTRFSYDYAFVHEGFCVLKVTRIDPLANQEITIHDTHGNAACHCYCDRDDQIRRSESTIYDTVGRKTAIRALVYNSLDQREVIETEWHYDSMGNETCCIEAKGTPEQKITRYHYNLYGQKEKTELPNGIILTHSYDELGRLTAYLSSDNTIHYTYVYDLKDRVKTVRDHIHEITTTRTYNKNGSLEKETLDHGYTLSYRYDRLDRPISITFPDKSAIHYHYNAHYLTSVERIKGRNVSTHCYNDYDLAGNVLSETSIHQGVLSYQYDLLQRTIQFDAPHWKEAIPQEGYDASGNLLKREVNDAEGYINYTYAYDDLYQLIAEDGQVSHTYQNDSLFNRVSKDTEPYALNSLNQVLSQNDSTYLYDSNGNLIEKLKGNLTVTYTYDALGRLITVNSGSQATKYTYDSFHRRTSKTINGVKTGYLYQGQNEIGAVVNNEITELRVLGITRGAEIGAAVAIELNGTSYAPIHDPYGNLVALLDSSGKIAENYRYTAFGETKVFSNTSLNNPWRYSSKRFDPETGFYYFGHRYYDPEIGRWTTPDPAGFADGPNLYTYAHNHPLAYIDPDGRLAWLLIPMAISLAAEYCLPAAVMCLEPYLCAEATGFLTGLVNGFNTNFFESAATKAVGYHNVGMAIGGALNLIPGKAASNVVSKGSQLVANVAAKELSGAATNALATKVSKWLSWFKPSAAPVGQSIQKTAQVAEKHLAKEGMVLSRGAENVNAGVSLNNKLSQLQKMQQSSANTRFLPDGRIRYYGKETFSKNFGPTRGASRVLELNPKTGSTRSWHECYDHFGNINRIHPKQINGQEIISPHYPLTAKELGF